MVAARRLKVVPGWSVALGQRVKYLISGHERIEMSRKNRSENPGTFLIATAPNNLSKLRIK